MKKILFFIFSVFLLSDLQAQVPTCGANVPFFQVDLTGQPSGIWISPWHSRVGQCCSVNNANNCTSFEIILDANAAMINFEVAGGAIPTGAMFYQINCGPQIPVGQPICITGTGPHHVTFCKPGNNENIYQITSIPKPTFPTDDTVRIGCVSHLEVLGLETSSVTWQSIFPGTPGQYDSYLSCTGNCVNPTYTPATTAPAFVDYEICGFPIADECGFVGLCDTIRIYNFGEMSGSVSPATGTFCAGGPGVTLTATGMGGDGNFVYIWRDPNNVIVSNISTCQATLTGNYSVEIHDGLYDAVDCPPLFLSVPVIQVLPPVVSAGLDQVHCADNPNSLLEATIANCTNVTWTGGNGIFTPSSTGSSVYYEPTPAEISVGQLTLTATSIGAGGGCAESSDQITLTFPPDISVNITTSSISCYGNNTTINATITGGAGTIDYLWNNGAVTPSITVTAGNYCVNVEDTLGCFASACSNVITPDPMTISLSSVDATAGNNGQASANVTGGTAPYNYSWYTVPAQSTQTATGLSTGIYTVVVTDQNGCSISSSVIVNNSFCSGLQASATSSNISCHGNNDGIGVASASGGVAPYSYAWQNPLSSTNDTVSDLLAGTYLVFVTDGNGCTDAATITVIEPLQLINVMNHTDVSVTAGTDGTATSNVTGGTMPYSYLWETAETTIGISNLSSGIYTLDITDASGCKISDSVLINEPNCTDFIIGVSSTPVSCDGGNDGTASVVVLHGDAPFNYEWSNGETTASISGLTAGTYSITVKDGLSCVTFQTIAIIEPSALSVTLAATQPSCADENDANIELIVSGGIYPFTYNWSNGAQAEDLFGIAPGNYSVVITDANNCSTSQSTTLTYPTSFSTSVSLTNVTCNNGSDGSIDLTASGGTGALNYVWSNGALSQDISGLTSGLYDVTITDQNGCNNSLPIEILINEPEVVANSYTTFDCPVPGSGEALVTVHPSGGSMSNYQVSFDGGITFLPVGDYDLSLPVDSTYSIILLDSNACVSPVADMVTVNPEVEISDAQFNTCFVLGDDFTLVAVTATGGYPSDYFISFDNGSTFNALSDYDESLQIGNAYSIIAQDTAGCLSVPFLIPIPSEMIISGTLSQFTNDNISCSGMNDGEIDATITGGTEPYDHDWSNNEITEDVTALVAGNYTLTITDSNGCVLSEDFTLTEPDSLLGTLAITTNYNGFDVSCYSSNDGAVDLNMTGGSQPYAFDWSNGAITEDISSLTAGTYDVTIIDNNGCGFNDNITLNRPDSIFVTDIVDDVLCNGFTDGAIDITATGGVTPYGFDWSNGETSEDITDLGPGNYSVTLNDDNGCIYIHTATVIELSPLVVSTSSSNVLCYGENNGSIDLTVSGGTIPYDFSWSNGTSNEDISSLTSGDYAVVITDVNDCMYTDAISITQPDSLFATASSPVLSNGTNISYNGGSDGTVDLVVTGGTLPYGYAWNNGATTEDLSGLNATSYEVMITDGNGCTYSLVIELEDPLVLEMPQGFSPNSDGMNDLFVIHGLEAYPENVMTIFNRWGNKVYEAVNYLNDWNGQRESTGDLLPDGTYFVILEISTPEEIKLKGYVELRK